MALVSPSLHFSGPDRWMPWMPRVLCVPEAWRALSGPCKWGRRKKSGQQADYRVHPCMGVGDGRSFLPLPKALARSPLKWGQVMPWPTVAGTARVSDPRF